MLLFVFLGVLVPLHVVVRLLVLFGAVLGFIDGVAVLLVLFLLVAPGVLLVLRHVVLLQFLFCFLSFLLLLFVCFSST